MWGVLYKVHCRVTVFNLDCISYYQSATRGRCTSLQAPACSSCPIDLSDFKHWRGRNSWDDWLHAEQPHNRTRGVIPDARPVRLTPTSRYFIATPPTWAQYVGGDLSSPQIISPWLDMYGVRLQERGVCRGEQIKGYQSDPVIERQLIVRPGTEQRHFFCLLIRLGSCGLLSRCICARG